MQAPLSKENRVTEHRQYAHVCAQDGLGIPVRADLALELFRLAAAKGDPEAQGQMGVRYALGLQHQTSWEAEGVAEFGEVWLRQSLGCMVVYINVCV
eukprot:1160095-Pelagomonas_calceolata.AAC.4